ncbi:MAG TPA: peptidylprolyl isomerase [Bryobacteraceae bacterium]|nr:peptidylprolyl isomerase [Bryobacteraceae bacterium]
MVHRIVVLLGAALPLAVAADVRVVEEIAAKVNNEIITRGDLDKARRDNEQRLRAEGLSGPRLAEAVNQANTNALEDLIDQILLVQKGKDLNIKVDPEINRELARIQVESKITDPEKFKDYVRENTGMSYEDYKDFLTRRLLAQRVIGQEVSYKIQIPDAELKKYYDEHQSKYVRKDSVVYLSQILLSTEGKTPEQVATAETKAKDITAKARKGEKFSDLVRENSDDPETAKNGGQLPPYQRGMLQPQIEAIVFKEKKGYITDPIKVPAGFLILKIEERFESGQASFEEVKQQIQEEMAAPRMEPKIREYLTRLREDAFLQIKDGYTDTGAAPGKDTRWKDVAQLKPQTTTKEEVASRIKHHKKVLFLPIPGTNKSTPAATPATPGSAPPAAPSTPPADPPASPVKQ